jgi:hypothetical protein
MENKEFENLSYVALGVSFPENILTVYPSESGKDAHPRQTILKPTQEYP